MRNKKKLILIFLSGFLLMGIGTGISFAEFSSFQYGGEKLVNGQITTITLETEVPEDTKTLYLKLKDAPFRNVRVEKDNSMEAGQITVEILCNQAFINPYLEAVENPDKDQWAFEAADEDQWYHKEVAHGEINQEMPLSSNKEERGLAEPGSVYFYLGANYFDGGSQASEFFQVKDDLLKNLKNRVISSYSYDVERGVVIKTPPQIETVINY